VKGQESKTRVVIGMDPHKRSVTIEVMDGDEHILGGGRYATDAAGYRSMLDHVRAWPNRVWAIEGCNGIGRHIAHRLIADGEQVVDVPPKLSARARVFATGQGRKTDATDAHSVALVGTRMTGLRPVVADEQLEVLRLLVDRRRSLGEEHTRKIAQLHRLLLELIPGGAKVFWSAAQARKLLASVRPRDVVGKTRKRVAMELVVDLEKIYARTKAADKELTELVKATGTRLLDLQGIGPSGAARLLVEVGDITRFPRPWPLRVLDRHRTHRRLLRRPRPAPPLPGRQPPDQPRASHHGRCSTAQPDRRAGLLRPEEGSRKDLDGSHALSHWMSMAGRARLACSSGTARDGLDVSPLDGLFELVALVVAGRRDRRERAAPLRAEQ